MLDIQCNFCDKPLSKKGAVLISPPSKSINRALRVVDETDICYKFHMCADCYDGLMLDRDIRKELNKEVDSNGKDD